MQSIVNLTERSEPMTVRSKEPVKFVGIDLAKRSFHLYGADAAGREVLRRKLTRKQLGALVVPLPACTIAMEACGSAHDWHGGFASTAMRFG